MLISQKWEQSLKFDLLIALWQEISSPSTLRFFSWRSQKWLITWNSQPDHEHYHYRGGCQQPRAVRQLSRRVRPRLFNSRGNLLLAPQWLYPLPSGWLGEHYYSTAHLPSQSLSNTSVYLVSTQTFDTLSSLASDLSAYITWCIYMAQWGYCICKTTH